MAVYLIIFKEVFVKPISVSFAFALDVFQQIRSELVGLAAGVRKNVSLLFGPGVNDQCW